MVGALERNVCPRTPSMAPVPGSSSSLPHKLLIRIGCKFPRFPKSASIGNRVSPARLQTSVYLFTLLASNKLCQPNYWAVRFLASVNNRSLLSLAKRRRHKHCFGGRVAIHSSVSLTNQLLDVSTYPGLPPYTPISHRYGIV